MNIAGGEIVRVLAIDPTTRGFGFAILEGPARLIDWGVRNIRGDKYLESTKKITELISTYVPEAIVLEDGIGPGSHRSPRVVRLTRGIARLAQARLIAVHHYSRAKIQDAFGKHGARTKHEIAIAIAREFTELAHRIPRYRKTWMPEDDRMHVFDAVSLALTFFHSEQKA